jgi:hypothetical protein
MRILRDLSPETKIIIESAGEERDRPLFLLASFLFFVPLALMSKASPADPHLRDRSGPGRGPDDEDPEPVRRGPRRPGCLAWCGLTPWRAGTGA